jgi:hypothetical protein
MQRPQGSMIIVLASLLMLSGIDLSTAGNSETQVPFRDVRMNTTNAASAAGCNELHACSGECDCGS